MQTAGGCLEYAGRIIFWGRTQGVGRPDLEPARSDEGGIQEGLE